jgi:predicted SprT family Zn-dependent metalloprotease
MRQNMILRFLGKMPRGRFEHTCTCGNYEITSIPKDKDDMIFSCKGCNARIHVWEQSDHWHISTNGGDEN